MSTLETIKPSRLIAAGVGLYLLVLPALLWHGHRYVPAPSPQGRKVERIFPRAEPPLFAAETRIFASNDEWRHVTVYEDLSPLPQDRYERGPLRIIMKASDDTNPEKNGRRYFVVLP